jgi:uncharacterized protein (DUF433 family)
VAVSFDIGSLLDSDPGFWDGRPFIRGKRVTVHRIAIAHSRGQSATEIADDFDLELSEVHAALAYYFVNQNAVDEDIDTYDAESLSIASQSGSTS